ncbi:GNAT family N-acetyltransferase [Methylovirgula sp. 4M-Z18]|uniref:GNAT family N-acetyltransferase n=1 Tax=Methylovirgula sp. 4M-Z18 TaxID=2293567 RepID=UPI000E2F3D23|nr:GNAT family N-acetyltransferase [Methylovirgula sp. 4M-Z18]RFB78575.1 GNAT family N-acetyltransferase [Methylovirgula sp. 4M-Z18]
MSLHIRPAARADAPHIWRFLHDLAEYEKLLDTFTVSEEKLADALFCLQPKVFCDLAEWNGAPAGIAIWYYNYTTFGGQHGIYLEDLYVGQSHRGLGLGRALLAHLAARCVAEDLVRLDWSVLTWNTPAIDFYKQLGAEMKDDWAGCKLTGAALRGLAASARR